MSDLSNMGFWLPFNSQRYDPQGNALETRTFKYTEQFQKLLVPHDEETKKLLKDVIKSKITNSETEDSQSDVDDKYKNFTFASQSKSDVNDKYKFVAISQFPDFYRENIFFSWENQSKIVEIFGTISFNQKTSEGEFTIFYQ